MKEYVSVKCLETQSFQGILERETVAEGMVFDAQAVSDAVAEGIAKIQNASSLEELKASKRSMPVPSRL